MLKNNFDMQWMFSFQGKTTTVDLPHDYSIAQKRDPNTRAGASNGFFPGGNARYEKSLHIPEQWRGKTVMLEFEGVYMNSVVRVNDHIVAAHPYGYTSFHCDLTPHLRFGHDNRICVDVRNDALPNTRWYSGSGIYRHVWLMTADTIHIAPYGIQVISSSGSDVRVQVTVDNKSKQLADVAIRASVIDRDGNQAACAQAPLCVSPGLNTAGQALTIPDAKLWSVESPYLYQLQIELIKDGAVVDSAKTAFGIRSIAVDAVNGFRLNGVPLKMKGGCVHHDCGILGAAAFDRAEERKVMLLKSSGFNAVRCAHNPPSPAFLDACDRLGMLVIDEAFDCWLEGKNPYDYNLSFEQNWKKDISSMVLRDINHPSIIMWSTGNEILERDGRSGGYEKSRMLAEYIRTLDTSRPITNAICDLWGEAMVTDQMRGSPDADHFAALTKDFAAPLDVVGYNYLKDRYKKDAMLFPGRVIAGTETFPTEAYEYWSLTESLPHIIGDFVWTSLDYLGEAGIGRVWYESEEGERDIYPHHHANCGDIDICGFKRAQSYYRDFLWGIGTTPYIAVYRPQYYGQKANRNLWTWQDVTNRWNWPGFEGKPVEIEVYSGGDEVELLLNGESLGRKPAGRAARYLARYETAYVPGELTAITYAGGVEQYRSSLKTAGEPALIRLSPDRTRLEARYGDLSFVTVELLDSEGNIACQASNELHFSVSGAGVLQAVGNGDSKSNEMYVGAVRSAYEGKAMAVIKTCGEKGRIVLVAMAEGLPATQIELFAGKE